jgi:hypothetical protein
MLGDKVAIAYGFGYKIGSMCAVSQGIQFLVITIEANALHCDDAATCFRL